jgi:hypothetical protein
MLPVVSETVILQVLGHVGRDVGEQRRAEIALAGVGQHAEDGRAPFGASRATCSAPAKVAPAVMPTKMPSFCASSWLHRIASAPGIVMMRSITFMSTASPVSFGMKSGLQPCIGCGLKAGCGAAGVPSGLRSCACRWSASARRPARTRRSWCPAAPWRARARRPSACRRCRSRSPSSRASRRRSRDDLARRGARVHVGIGLVLELAGQEPAVRLGQLDRLLDHARPRSAAGVRTTLAPRKRISLRRSTLNVSAMVTTSG